MRSKASTSIPLILNILTEEYPKYVEKGSLQQATSLLDKDLERHIRYLEKQGLIEVRWIPPSFAAKVNISWIDYVGKEIVDRETFKKILAHLRETFPDYIRDETFKELLDIDDEQLRRPFAYLEEKGLVDIQWFAGKRFMVKVTSHGINQLENL